MPLTLNGAKKKIEALNGNGPPPDEKIPHGRRRVSKQEQLECWRAMVDWFSGDHSPEIRDKLVWQPMRSLGFLLPQPPAYQPGVDDPRVCQARAEHWRMRYWISLETIIEEWLNEKSIPAEEIKKPRYLKRGLKEAGDMITLPDAEWGPILEDHNEYFKHYPAAEVKEGWTINYCTYRVYIKRYADGTLTKNINREEDTASPNFKPPGSRPLKETKITPFELLDIIKKCF